MRSLVAVFFLFVVSGFAPAAAQTMIHHCVGANGGPVFTDQPCIALDATPLVRPAAAATRRASAAPVTLCAANGSQLKHAVTGAFAAHDANRLAGIMLWSGYAARAAVVDIRALQRVVREPLLGLSTDPAADVESAPALGDSTSPPPEASVPTTLAVQTQGGDGTGGMHSLRFDVVRRAGCLWLRIAGTPDQQDGE